MKIARKRPARSPSSYGLSINRAAVAAFFLAAFCLLLFADLSNLGQCAAPPGARIKADGETISLSGEFATTAAALAQAGIVLGPWDRVAPGLDEPLGATGEIVVTRVELRVIREIIVEPHETTVLADPSLRPGMVLRPRKGQDGQILREIHIWSKEGLEMHREVVAESRLQERKDAVEIHASAGLPSRGTPNRILRTLTMEATAYEPGPRSCGRFADGYTSIGLKAGRGIAAVDPRVIPMRSKLYIEGYGFAIAGDVGSAIKGNRIDVCYETVREALQFGRRKVKVYILE